MTKRFFAFFLTLVCLFCQLPAFGLSPIRVQAAQTIPDILLYEHYPNCDEFQILHKFHCHCKMLQV